MTCELVEFDRPRRLTIHGEARGMSFDDHIALEAVDGATHLTATMHTSPKGLFRLVAPIMGRVVDKQFQTNWDLLAAALRAPAG